mmetsp:Transcript_66400/g.214006  ORF Transcript_66400/g.214006 Transcript_66400/m.214006 type:complete len:107 (+) Transcript_66400:29-349(+)
MLYTLLADADDYIENITSSGGAAFCGRVASLVGGLSSWAGRAEQDCEELPPLAIKGLVAVAPELRPRAAELLDAVVAVFGSLARGARATTRTLRSLSEAEFDCSLA